MRMFLIIIKYRHYLELPKLVCVEGFSRVGTAGIGTMNLLVKLIVLRRGILEYLLTIVMINDPTEYFVTFDFF